MAGAELVLGLGGVGIDDRASVGGKAAGLGELVRLGAPVPPGFVVTTDAFETALRTLDPGGTIRRDVARLSPDDHEEVARVSGVARRRIVAAPLPHEVSAAIVRNYYVAFGAGAPVAVRSSATSEDAADASFAGLQATDLWVRGADAVTDSVRRCWASLYNTESVSYRLRRGFTEESLSMAVVVEQMVDARAAGVMFTRSPTTGDRSIIALEACWGLGSALVSGDVTPDRYAVSKVTGEIVSRTVSVKRRRHRKHPCGAGVYDDEVPADLQETPCVGDEEIREIAELGRTIERHHGAPQDIEWAIDDDAPTGGRALRILQARPDTTAAGQPDAPVAGPRGRPFDHVLGRMMGKTPSRPGPTGGVTW